MVFTLGYVKSQCKYFSDMNISEEDYEPMDVSGIQHYNPMYSRFFEMNDNTYNNISLNQKYSVCSETQVITNDGKKLESPVFIKYAPLLDPVHYLIGKYTKYEGKLCNLPTLNNKDSCVEKIYDVNNSSYVDNFFNYLSSQLLHQNNFCHGIDYYGSNLAVQKKFRFDVSEDLDYLEESGFFNKNNGVLYEIDDYNKFVQTKNTQSKRPRIQIIDECIPLENVIEENEIIEDNEDGDREIEPEIVFECTKEDDDDDSDEDSIVCNSDDEDSDDEDSDDEDSDDEDDDEEDEEDEGEEDEGEEEDVDELYAYVYNFPVQMIALEKCDGTFDQLLEDEELECHEIISALLQVIFTLIVYQKAFSFTHNDLHTNNILYKKTNEKFLYYKYQNNVYKLPTYGRIYKIIDFGRAIYKYRDQLMCSDSFAPSGDANGQYNTEPYLNDSKARLEPNFSFDLCRLACSMYDFVFEDDIPKNKDDAQTLIWEWCQDDYGKNILYKRNGEERYPNFKLYKMISRIVHKHTPENQLERSIFKKFIMKSKPPKQIMNIDSIEKHY
jgi:hypothetical protein